MCCKGIVGPTFFLLWVSGKDIAAPGAKFFKIPDLPKYFLVMIQARQ